jgi:hypothetical protein
MELLVMLRRQPADDLDVGVHSWQEGGSRGVERSLKSLHAMRSSLARNPERIIEEYVARARETLGVSAGQAWALTDLNRRMSWGRHKGLQRMHYMLAEVFERLDQKGPLEAQSLVAQCLKAVHQACLDDGDWKTAWLLTTLRDPLRREKFGGSERELEIISSYSRAMEELETRVRKGRDAHGTEEADTVEEQETPAEGSTGRGRGRGRGRGKQ